MGEILSFDLLNFEALDAELDAGRVLSEEELRELADYYLTHPRKCPYMGSWSWSRLRDLMEAAYLARMEKHSPTGDSTRFTWHTLVYPQLGEPMLWFRNDQTGLILLCYRPEQAALRDLKGLLFRAIRDMFPVLGVPEDMTELYLSRDHEILPRGAGPEDAALALAVPWLDRSCRFRVAYNCLFQQSACLWFAKNALLPDLPAPVKLLEKVLRALSGEAEVFHPVTYVFQVTLDQVADRVADEILPEGNDYDFRPISQMRPETRQALLAGESTYGLYLPPEEAWEQVLVMDADSTFYELHLAIHNAFGWEDYWNTFSSPEADFTAFDGDEMVGAFMDHPPETMRSTSDMLLRAYFEKRRVCIYDNSQFRCTVVLLETTGAPMGKE